MSVSLHAREYELKIEPADYLLERFLNGAQLRAGLWNNQAVGLSDREYERDNQTELLLTFNDDPVGEILRGEFDYDVVGSEVYIQDAQWYRGGAAGLFLAGQPIELEAGAESFFAPGRVWNAFSMEFWIYPAELTGEEEIFYWQGLSWLGERPQIQEFIVQRDEGRLEWNLENFFINLAYNEELEPELNYRSVSLRSRRTIVPRTWSHHLLRYDSSRGVIEYLINGVSEAVVHLTNSGRESGDAFLPHIGEESDGGLRIGGNYHGFMDDFRVQRDWVDEPMLEAAEKRPGYAVIGPIDLNYDGARLTGLDALYRTPGNSDVQFSVLQQEVFNLHNYFADRSAWTSVELGALLDEPAGPGRYLFLRMDFLPDGSADNIPLVQNITLKYERDPAPPAPATIISTSRNGAVHLSWNKVLGADGYLLYYGDEPGNYFGRDSSLGLSPIDLGNVDEFLLDGLMNGKMYYFKIASYNTYNSPVRGLYRERRLSPEVFARPRRQ